jgi:hypothetical protein
MKIYNKKTRRKLSKNKNKKYKLNNKKYKLNNKNSLKKNIKFYTIKQRGGNWTPKDSENCVKMIRKLANSSNLDKLKDSSIDETYKFETIEDNGELHKIFTDFHECLPERISNKHILPLVAMIPQHAYLRSL